MPSHLSRPFSGRPRYLHLLASVLQVVIMLALLAAAVVLLTRSVSAQDGRGVIPSSADHPHATAKRGQGEKGSGVNRAKHPKGHSGD